MTPSQLDERIEFQLDGCTLGEPDQELHEQVMLTAATRALEESTLEEIIEAVERLGYAHYALDGDAPVILQARCLIETQPQRVKAVFAALAGRKPCPVEQFAVNAELSEITSKRIGSEEILQAARCCGIYLLGEEVPVLTEEPCR